MNKRIKGLIVALGLSILISPSVARADALTDPYISKIRSGEILPPQYVDLSLIHISEPTRR